MSPYKVSEYKLLLAYIDAIEKLCKASFFFETNILLYT